MANFDVGDEVEIKGFNKWVGLTLLGEIVCCVKDEFYVVEVDVVTDPDESGEYLNRPLDNAYYSQKQERYHVVHKQFVREAERREDGLEYNVGDVVDWEEGYIFVKGTVIGKEIDKHDRIGDPNRFYCYVVRLDESDEVVDAEYYDIRPHVPWA